MTGVIGIIWFYVKTILIRKFIGFQCVKLEEKLRKNFNNGQECFVVIEKIRVRKTDLNVIGLIAACFEDCPQIIIVIVVTTTSIGHGWTAITLATLCASMVSFLIKFWSVTFARFGCVDPNISNDDTPLTPRTPRPPKPPQHLVQMTDSVQSGESKI